MKVTCQETNPFPPETCPSCGKIGPDTVTEVDDGIWEAACGDDYHEGQMVWGADLPAAWERGTPLEREMNRRWNCMCDHIVHHAPCANGEWVARGSGWPDD